MKRPAFALSTAIHRDTGETFVCFTFEYEIKTLDMRPDEARKVANDLLIAADIADRRQTQGKLQ